MREQDAELWVDLSQALKHVHGYDHLARTFARLDEDCHRLAMVGQRRCTNGRDVFTELQGMVLGRTRVDRLAAKS